MTMDRKWVLKVLLGASLAACSGDEPVAVVAGTGAGPVAGQGAAGAGAGSGVAEAGSVAAGVGGGVGAGTGTEVAGTGGLPEAGATVAGSGAGAAGAGGPQAGGGAGTGGGDPMGCDADPHHPDCIDTHVRGKCDIDSGYPGDETCLAPPPPGQGIQIHIGPEDYDNPDQVAVHIFEPGNESSECFNLVTPNDEDVYYQSYVLSGRPGTHHIINTGFTTPHPAGTTGSISLTNCRGGVGNVGPRIPGAAKHYMERMPVAPENEGLGYLLGAQTAMQSDMHYFNFSEGPILREYWLNLYTIPADKVEVTPNRIRGYGGLAFNITPGTDQVYSYSCPINADGRITTLLGHVHAHAVRFTAWVNRAALGERQKVFETFDYLEPRVFAYNTIEVNPDFSEGNAGAYTGILEVSAGDTLDWECHVINDSEFTLRFTNEVETGEMCNIWGESVGPLIDCNRF